jgi:glycosyltransferase involved in cell wall biosynthesis
VLCNGAVIARVTADRYRADLERAGIGDGRHAFELLMRDGLAANQRHEIELRCADDWTLLPASPRAVGGEGGNTLDSGATPIEAVGPLEGRLDYATHAVLRGWAWTTSNPTRPVFLTVSVNDEIVGRFPANRFRADLQQAGVGDGRHSFEFVFPRGLSRTEAQVIGVRREADGQEIPGSPWVLPAATGYGPDFEDVLADVLAKVSSPADEDAALTLLTRQTELLLARRAERTGGKAEREAQRLFQRRWGRAPDQAEAAASFEDTGPRALVIDERTPCARRDAGSVAILSHIRALKALGYAVTFAAFETRGEEAELQRLAEDEGIATCGRPHYSGVEDVLYRQAGNFDLVYLHRLTMTERYLNLARGHMPKARVIFGVADLHHLRLSRQARVEQRPQLLALAGASERRELFVASQADLVFTHSPVEAAMLRKYFAHKVRVVPFAVGEHRPPPPFTERRGVAFLGSFAHTPNSDAAFWLVNAILPRVWRENPALTCKIAGYGWQKDGLGPLDPRVEIAGPVENLDELFGAIRLTVAPLRFGAGIKGKVLESLAAGLPCVMSEVAAEGLPLAAPLTDLVARDAADFAARILRLHDDEAANADLGSRARALVAEHFTQDHVTDSLRTALAGPTSGAAVHQLVR